MYMSYDYFVKFHDFFFLIFERRHCIIRYSGSYVSYMLSKAIGCVLKTFLLFTVF